MARFTVSDCMEKIQNRYELTLAASIRSRQIEHGSPTLLSRHENDKPTVLALREIADGHINSTILRNIG
ncbi:MAG: DNA-directed RNA polymerase subunit omega [Neisseriaceae bacterium]